jgi:hypothetical protein
VNALPGLAAVGVIQIVGFALVRALGFPPRTDRLAATGWSYVAGAFATGVVLVLWLGAGLPLSAVAINATLLAVAGILWAVGARGRRAPPEATAGTPPAEDGPSRSAPGWQRAVFASAIVLALAVTCDRALLTSLRPVMDSDEAFIWSSRAKVLFHAGGLNDRFGAEMNETVAGAADVVSHKDYPLLDSLLHVLAYVDAGRITDFANRLPIQAFGLALVLVLGAGLRRIASPLIAAALVVMVVSEAPLAWALRFSMADGMVAVGLLCAADAFLRGAASGEAAWSRLGGVALGFLAWSKHEGAMLAGLVAVLVLVADRRRWAWWLLPPVAIVALTWAVNAAFGFRNDLVQSGSGGTIWTRLLLPFGPRGADVAARFWRDWAGSQSASRLLLLPLVLLLFSREVRARRALAGLGLMLVAALGVELWIFSATPRDFEWHWTTAAVRVLSQLSPTIALAVGGMAGAFVSVRRATPPTRST